MLGHPYVLVPDVYVANNEVERINKEKGNIIVKFCYPFDFEGISYL